MNLRRREFIPEKVRTPEVDMYKELTAMTVKKLEQRIKLPKFFIRSHTLHTNFIMPDLPKTPFALPEEPVLAEVLPIAENAQDEVEIEAMTGEPEPAVEGSRFTQFATALVSAMVRRP